MRPRWIFTASMTMVLIWIGTIGVQAASGFAVNFEGAWNQAEKVQPNFWGPLATAREGQTEPYKEATDGKRTVQYFDKARMEQAANGRVTTGLLTVELKSGNLQLGDGTFEQRSPAQVNMAGDPGTDGLVYADLAKLNESYPDADTTPNAYVYTNDHNFRVLSTDEGKQYSAQFDVPAPNATFVYQQDPSGRFGQYIYAPFLDFTKSLAAAGIPVDQTPGYAISPVMIAQVPIGGKSATIFIQAFERRVLTYNPNNPAAFRVEFGNIGQHYYRWRYGG